jgi:hypothetical protein
MFKRTLYDIISLSKTVNNQKVHFGLLVQIMDVTSNKLSQICCSKRVNVHETQQTLCYVPFSHGDWLL